jgi:hypothetical protein
MTERENFAHHERKALPRPKLSAARARVCVPTLIHHGSRKFMRGVPGSGALRRVLIAGTLASQHDAEIAASTEDRRNA